MAWAVIILPPCSQFQASFNHYSDLIQKPLWIRKKSLASFKIDYIFWRLILEEEDFYYEDDGSSKLFAFH